eukprot:scaffold15719_cov146-Isochrysis_galbana.AAC.1
MQTCTLSRRACRHGDESRTESREKACESQLWGRNIVASKVEHELKKPKREDPAVWEGPRAIVHLPRNT